MTLMTDTHPPSFSIVQKLFQVLRDDGLIHLYREKKDNGEKVLSFEAYWQDRLHPRYHCFAGNYHSLPLPCKDFHRFEETKEPEPPYARLRLAPPATSEAVVFLNDDEYAKRLVGLVRSKFWIIS